MPTLAIEKQVSGHRRVREAHTEEIAQDYVETIASLIAESGEARVVDLARCLGVTHVTVSQTVGRLRDQGLVTNQPYRSIFLTAAGRKLAEEARGRHDTVLEFLIKLGVPEQTAIVDAEGIEHHVSPPTLAAMKKFVKSKSRGTGTSGVQAGSAGRSAGRRSATR
jgi:DtxR family transcriptional regulator, manganese transport regulator